MKKKILAIALMVILSALTCACGAGFTEDDAYYGSSEGGSGYAAEDAEYYDEALYDDADYDAAGSLSADLTSSNSAAPQETEKKIIRNANVNMLALDVKETYAEILDFAKKDGGYEFSQNTSTTDTYTSIEAEIKIPAGKLDAFLEFIDECGEVTSCNVSANDITDDYYDAETRLRTTKATLEQYYERLEEAKNIDEILKVQKVIDGLTEDIEAWEGMLRLWNSQVDESRVTLSIYQKDDPNAVDVPEITWDTMKFSDMGKLALSGMVKVANWIVKLFMYLLIVIVWLSPIWVPIAVLIFVLVWRFKSKKKKLNAGAPRQ